MALVLIADDDPELVALQRALLETIGHQVETALCPIDALERLNACHPDVMVVDLRIPHAADGLRLVRDIRESGSRIPLILLSGWPDEVYGSSEEPMISRVLVKGCARELLQAISELVVR